MLRHPSQWAALAADAAARRRSIEETLRYDPPVQLMARIAARGHDRLAMSRCSNGDIMMLLLAAAHRDPAEYDRPDNFDPDRETMRHLGFGRGAHYCLGAPLARLEAGVALVGGDGAFPGRPPGRRAAVQAERHVARAVYPDGRGLTTVPRAGNPRSVRRS